MKSMSNQFFKACELHDRKLIEELLNEGEDINQKDEDGDNCLVTVFYNFNDKTLEFTNFLIEKGANINSQNKLGQTSLMISMNSSNETVSYLFFKELLKYHPNIKLKDADGDDIFIYLEMYAENPIFLKTISDEGY